MHVSSMWEEKPSNPRVCVDQAIELSYGIAQNSSFLILQWSFSRSRVFCFPIEPKALDDTNQDKPGMFSVSSTTSRETVLSFVPIM